MFIPRIALLSLALITTGACSALHRQSAPVQITDNGATSSSRWTATLATPSALRGALEIRGTAWMAPDSGRTLVSITLANAAPGGVHPWHVDRGRCGSNGQILGSGDAYTPLKVGAGGTARAQADLPIAISRSGDYSVTVYAAPGNMTTIIACGNLAPPIQ